MQSTYSGLALPFWLIQVTHLEGIVRGGAEHQLAANIDKGGIKSGLVLP